MKKSTKHLIVCLVAAFITLCLGWYASGRFEAYTASQRPDSAVLEGALVAGVMLVAWVTALNQFITARRYRRAGQ